MVDAGEADRRNKDDDDGDGACVVVVVVLFDDVGRVMAATALLDRDAEPIRLKSRGRPKVEVTGVVVGGDERIGVATWLMFADCAAYMDRAAGVEYMACWCGGGGGGPIDPYRDGDSRRVEECERKGRPEPTRRRASRDILPHTNRRSMQHENRTPHSLARLTSEERKSQQTGNVRLREHKFGRGHRIEQFIRMACYLTVIY